MPVEDSDDRLTTTSRLEAFSDGVFAIAITLLILDIAVPAARQGRLWADLGRLGPHYGAYAISAAAVAQPSKMRGRPPLVRLRSHKQRVVATPSHR